MKGSEKLFEMGETRISEIAGTIVAEHGAPPELVRSALMIAVALQIGNDDAATEGGTRALLTVILNNMAYAGMWREVGVDLSKMTPEKAQAAAKATWEAAAGLRLEMAERGIEAMLKGKLRS